MLQRLINFFKRKNKLVDFTNLSAAVDVIVADLKAASDKLAATATELADADATKAALAQAQADLAAAETQVADLTAKLVAAHATVEPAPAA